MVSEKNDFGLLRKLQKRGNTPRRTQKISADGRIIGAKKVMKLRKNKLKEVSYVKAQE